MKEKKKLTKKKLIIMTFVILMAFSILYLGFTSLKYRMLYDEAIHQGTENIVTALEMLVVCQEIGNITIEDIEKGYMEKFILYKEKKEVKKDGM